MGEHTGRYVGSPVVLRVDMGRYVVLGNEGRRGLLLPHGRATGSRGLECAKQLVLRLLALGLGLGLGLGFERSFATEGSTRLLMWFWWARHLRGVIDLNL